MKRLLLASAALVALTGVAYSQEAPYLAGNYSASVAKNQSADRRGRDTTYVIRDYDGPRVYYRSMERPRYVYRDYDGPRYVARDYYWDDYYGPRYHRHAFAPRAGFSIGFGGPGWGVGFHDYNYWR
jgi:hypothetical protein